MACERGARLSTHHRASLIERLIGLLALTVLVAAVPFIWRHGLADARSWVLGAAVGGVLLLSRERRRAGTYRADVAVCLLLVQSAGLYLLARDHLGISGTWFLVSLLLVVVAITSLLQRLWIRLLALGWVLFAAAWGWRWAGAGGDDLVVLLLAVLSVVSLVLLLDRRHRQVVADQLHTGERHRRSAALLSAVTELSGDTTLVTTGITRALAGIGFQEVVIGRVVRGRLELLATAGARPAAGPPPGPLQRLLEMTLTTGHQITATIPGDRPAGGAAATPPRRALVVPIAGTDRPRGVLCGLAAEETQLGVEAERWARAFAGHLGTLWRREETLELEHAHLMAAAGLQQTRSAFLRSVSGELAPGAAAVRSRSREVLAACVAAAPPVGLSRLQHEAGELRGSVDMLLLMADIARHADADLPSTEDATLGRLADRLTQHKVELVFDARLRGQRLQASPELLARALALWLRPAGTRGARRLQAQRLGRQLLLRAPSVGGSVGTGAGAPAHGSTLEQLLQAAGAGRVDRGGVRVPLAPVTQLEHG